MLQCGDPTGTGSGGPGLLVRRRARRVDETYGAGTLAMANAGPDTNGSQFFIVYGDTQLAAGLHRLRQRRRGHRRSDRRRSPTQGTDDSNGAGDGAPKHAGRDRVRHRRLTRRGSERERARRSAARTRPTAPWRGRGRAPRWLRPTAGRPAVHLAEPVRAEVGVAGHVHRGGVQRRQRTLPRPACRPACGRTCPTRS